MGTSGPDQRGRFAARAWFWHLGVYRDEQAGQPARRRQPGPGISRFSRPAFVKEAAKAAIDADLNQYAISHGAPRLRAAIARTWNERYGMDVDPDREITVTSRRHRGHLRRGTGARCSWGRDSSLRTVLRFVSAQRDHGGRVAAGGDAAAARLVIRSAGSRCRIWAAHAGAPAQHAP